MKAHTSNFKNSIKQFGRQIDSIIKFGDIELGSEELNSITPTFQGDLLKSTMKELIIDSNIEIPVNSIINYKFGVKVKNDNVIDYRDNYEYIDFGDYIVQEVNKKEDTNSYEIKCYDFMLRSMTEYHELEIGTFPMTVRQYITNLCNQLSLEFANENEMFVNDDKIINSDVYKNIGYTYRDIFDDLAEVTASSICINNDNKVEIRYINDTQDEIDEEYLKDINVNFGEKYGPINSIVLSRSGESDNVFKQNSKSVKENGLCELKIIDNQIMNFENRGTYLDELLSQLDGTEYYINDYSSFGICYYDLCDRYNIKIGDNTYSCIMFNDEINVTQGLEENIHTDMPVVSETPYKYESEIEKKINQTYIIVDKQNQSIKSVVSQIGDRGEKETTITEDLDSISSQVKSVPTITTENGGTGELKFENIKAGKIVTLRVHPTDKDILGLFATPLLKASRGLKALSRKVYFDGDEDFSYMIPCNLYFYGDVYDEFIYDGVKEEIYVNHKIGINDDGEKYVMDITVREDFEYYDFNIGNGNYKIFMSTYPTAYIYFKAMIDNDYTNIFATKIEMKSEIKQTADNILLEVDKKVDEDDIIAKLNVAVKDDKGIVELVGNAVTIDSDNFKLDETGNIEGNNAKLTNVNITGGKIEFEDDGTLGDSKIIIKKSKFSNDVNRISSWGFTAEDLDTGTRTMCNIGAISVSSDGAAARVEWDRIYIFDKNSHGYQLDATNGLTHYSDRSLKSNIENIDLNKSINIIKELYPVEFNYNDSEKKHRGLIAQNVVEVLNKNNIYNQIYAKDKNDKLMLNYEEFIADIINCNKYLINKVDELEKRIEVLENERT